jgi:UDP-glucose 4-epimerase
MVTMNAKRAGRVLVTGATGYIGSHTCLELLAAGCEVAGFDNLSNSSEESLRRVRQLAGKTLAFTRLDLLDRPGLDALLKDFRPDAVIHFAGLKAVGESVEKPLLYWRNNVEGTLNLLEAMRGAGCRSLVFSSSCTIYGQPETLPISEDCPVGAASPYGRTKLAIERLCEDLAGSEKGWHIALLRYFNPIGAHESGRIGEDPRGIPNNLLPYALQVAVGQRPVVRVFGSDYPTPDGTGVRDYIHVVDLALGHLKALERLPDIDGCRAFNLGTGRGYSVLEVIKALEKASGRAVKYELAPRRAGDVTAVYADPRRAREELGWSASRDLARMCEDAWRWQSQNPKGYR